jgi:redox-sensing transcriptional repressor
MKNTKYISNAVIRRLPRYYRYLGELMNNGIPRISSGELSERMGLTASQVRQDLNHFGDFGQQGYGYNVEMLHEEIGRILGLERQHKIIIIGAGHLGTALTNYANFEKRGFQVAALFDINPDIIGTEINGRKVLDFRGIRAYLKEVKVDIAVLTLPKAKAAEVASLLEECGIKAFWNFASVDLHFSDPNVVVENVHLSDSLMTLSYRMARQN